MRVARPSRKSKCPAAKRTLLVMLVSLSSALDTTKIAWVGIDLKEAALEVLSIRRGGRLPAHRARIASQIGRLRLIVALSISQ
jgi:hypothetical protein